jgi:hypothetical protein
MNFTQQVEQVAESAAVAGPGPWTIDESSGPLRFNCELTVLETLACAFTRFEMTNQAWATAPIGQVELIAESLAKRLTYLLEPSRPIETDTEECIVQMRSSPPRRNDDGSIYYELHVKRGGILSLCRYEKQPGDVRRAISIQVTREVFRHLLDDFAAAQ